MMANEVQSTAQSTIAEVTTAFGPGLLLDIQVNETTELVVYVVRLNFGGTLYAASPEQISLKLKPERRQSDNNNIDAAKTVNTQNKQIGKVVHCAPFGCGKVIDYREHDHVYAVKLAFGTLYAPVDNVNREDRIMKLNVAYEALEKMRLLNQEIACHEMGVKFDPTKCTQCLRKLGEPGSKRSRYGRKSKASKGTPCFICASPTCKAHSCPEFRQEGSTVCLDCKHLYSLDYALDILSANTAREQSELLQKMFDVYDRTIIMLKFASQYIDEIADGLKKNKKMKNQVGIGSSSAGIVSGSLGVAATACLLTPAAAIAVPSLIIASIFFGGTSSAMQTGVEYNINSSEPNIVANRTIALYGMAKAIVRTCDVVCGVLVSYEQSHHRKIMNMYDDFAANHRRASGSSDIKSTISVEDEKKQSEVECATPSPEKKLLDIENDVTVKETGAAAGKNARFAARSGVNSVSLGSNVVSAGQNVVSVGSSAAVSTGSSAASAAASTGSSAAAASAGSASAATSAATSSVTAGSTAVTSTAMTAAQFAAFAGGALSAAVLLYEVYGMSKIIKAIGHGSQCPKADLLRKIKLELASLPETNSIEMECKDCTDKMVEPLSLSKATDLITDLLGSDNVPADWKKFKCNVSKRMDKIDEDDDEEYTLLAADSEEFSITAKELAKEPSSNTRRRFWRGWSK